MADSNVEATLEENRQLREQIEAVQIERRRNFSEADKVHEEVQARRENERLREVLESQQAMLDRSAEVRDSAGEEADQSRADTPYTITKDGPVYSTPNTGERKGKATRESNRPAAGRTAPPQSPPLNVGLGGVEDDKEN